VMRLTAFCFQRRRLLLVSGRQRRWRLAHAGAQPPAERRCSRLAFYRCASGESVTGQENSRSLRLLPIDTGGPAPQRAFIVQSRRDDLKVAQDLNPGYPAHVRTVPRGTAFSPKASATSLPLPLLRLLPGGTNQLRAGLSLKLPDQGLPGRRLVRLAVRIESPRFPGTTGNHLSGKLATLRPSEFFLGGGMPAIKDFQGDHISRGGQKSHDQCEDHAGETTHADEGVLPKDSGRCSIAGR